LDSGASCLLMPKVQEKWGLEVARPYKDLYSFDSKRVPYIGMIKDLVVTLALFPRKCVMMDVIVADVPPNYGTCYQEVGGLVWGGIFSWT
jgi:hypothetical protein